jgi:hypothetical protein
MTRRSVAFLATAVVLCAAEIAWAQDLGSAQTSGPFLLEWESRQTGGGQAVVSGYVHNRHQMRAQRIRVRVDTLDAASRPSSTRIVDVMGTIPSQDRGYFEVRVPSGDAPHRVTVDSVDWYGCGDG